MFRFLKKNIKTTTREQVFWNYFLSNKKKLEKFINSDLTDYTAFNEITDEIRKYSSLLFVEITQKKDGKYVLIITPDGNINGIEDAEKLFEAKPEIENWIVEKFRQSKNDLKLEYGGIKIPSSDIEIIPNVDIENEKINLKVYIRNMHLDEKNYQVIAWLYLDNILGEYNSITKIGYVDFFNFDDSEKLENGITILELRKLIEKELYKAK